MAHVEVNLKEDDETPEQHLDDGEYIERVLVPINQLYDRLSGELNIRLLRPLCIYQSSHTQS